MSPQSSLPLIPAGLESLNWFYGSLPHGQDLFSYWVDSEQWILGVYSTWLTWLIFHPHLSSPKCVTISHQERDLLPIRAEACHPRNDFSLSPITACLCQSSSESSLDLEGKSHSGAHSLIGFIVCLSKWVKNSLVFFFLPNLLCVGNVTSRQPHTRISGELGIYWDFKLWGSLFQQPLIGKRSDPCRLFLEEECREMEFFKKVHVS